MAAVPPMHQLIRGAGVMVKDSVCSCCACRPLYEICSTPTLKSPAAADVFLVCAACDVQVEHRQN